MQAKSLSTTRLSKSLVDSRPLGLLYPLLSYCRNYREVGRGGFCIAEPVRLAGWARLAIAYTRLLDCYSVVFSEVDGATIIAGTIPLISTSREVFMVRRTLPKEFYHRLQAYFAKPTKPTVIGSLTCKLSNPPPGAVTEAVVGRVEQVVELTNWVKVKLFREPLWRSSDVLTAVFLPPFYIFIPSLALDNLLDVVRDLLYSLLDSPLFEVIPRRFPHFFALSVALESSLLGGYPLKV